MRRTLTSLALTVALTALHALPALAAEGGGGSEVAKGSMQGIVLAAVFGILVGTGLTIHAYRGIRFGGEPGHHEQADDTRQGLSDYEPDVPSGTA